MRSRVPIYLERNFRVMKARGVSPEEVSRILWVDLDHIKSRMPRPKRKYVKRKRSVDLQQSTGVVGVESDNVTG